MGCEWLWGFKGLFWWRIPHMIASIMGISPTGVTSWDIFGCVRTHTRIHQLPIRFVQNTHIHEFHMSCLKTGWYLMVPHGTSFHHPMVHHLSTFLRYGLAFGTRDLKTRVPERAFWVDSFSSDPKLMYFLGLDTETFYPPNKKGFWEFLWAQNGGWSHQKVDLPNSGSFFGWSKKGSGFTKFVGQVRFPFWILFFSERKTFWPHNFYRSAIYRGPRRLWKMVEKPSVTQWILSARSKKGIGRLPEPKTTITPPAFGTFAFCVLTVLSSSFSPLKWLKDMVSPMVTQRQSPSAEALRQCQVLLGFGWAGAKHQVEPLSWPRGMICLCKKRVDLTETCGYGWISFDLTDLISKHGDMEVSWGEWWHNGLFDGIFNCNKMEVNECFGQLGCPFQPCVSTWTTWPIIWDDWLRFSAGWHHDIPILLVKRQNTQHTFHVFKLLASFVSMYWRIYVQTYHPFFWLTW